MKKYQNLNKRRALIGNIVSTVQYPAFLAVSVGTLGVNIVSALVSMLILYIVRKRRNRSLIYSIEDTDTALFIEYYDYFRLRKDFIAYDDMDAYFDHFNKRVIIISSKKASTYWPKYFHLIRRETDEEWLMSVFDAHGISIPNK